MEDPDMDKDSQKSVVYESLL